MSKTRRAPARGFFAFREEATAVLPPAHLRTVTDVALVTGRPQQTLFTWARRGRIRSASNARTRQLLLSLTDAVALSQQAEHRTQRAA